MEASISQHKFTLFNSPQPCSHFSTLTGIVKKEGGVYKVVTAIAGHKPGDTISESRATELAEFLTPPMSELDRVLVAVPSPSSASQNHNDDYYPDMRRKI